MKHLTLFVSIILFLSIGGTSYSKDFYDLRTFAELREKNLTKPEEVKNWTVRTVVRICDSLEIESPHVILAIMSVETGGKLNPLINKNYKFNPNRPYIDGGVFQIPSGYTRRWSGDTANLCQGIDRHCLYKAIPAIWVKLEHRRRIIETRMGRWNDLYYYTRIHNPGLAGIRTDSDNKWAPVARRFHRELEYWKKEVEVVRNMTLLKQIVKEIDEIRNPKELLDYGND